MPRPTPSDPPGSSNPATPLRHRPTHPVPTPSCIPTLAPRADSPILATWHNYAPPAADFKPHTRCPPKPKVLRSEPCNRCRSTSPKETTVKVFAGGDPPTYRRANTCHSKSKADLSLGPGSHARVQTWLERLTHGPGPAAVKDDTLVTGRCTHAPHGQTLSAAP